MSEEEIDLAIAGLMRERTAAKRKRAAINAELEKLQRLFEGVRMQVASVQYQSGVTVMAGYPTREHLQGLFLEMDEAQATIQRTEKLLRDAGVEYGS